LAVKLKEDAHAMLVTKFLSLQAQRLRRTPLWKIELC